MADHRIRLTDRELTLARSAAMVASRAMLPKDQELSKEYTRLHQRLEHTKPGGMPTGTRNARRLAKGESPG